jgi:hypothetical protein
MIRIENKRTYRGAGVYIGRPSLLGNPYRASVCGRQKAIMLYRRWLWDRINERGEVYDEVMRLAELVAKQGDLTLICWCSPEQCHGDIVKRSIEWLNSDGGAPNKGQSVRASRPHVNFGKV